MLELSAESWPPDTWHACLICLFPLHLWLQTLCLFLWQKFHNIIFYGENRDNLMFPPTWLITFLLLMIRINETWKFIPQTHLLFFVVLQTRILINSTLCSSFQQFKRMFGVFITEYAMLLSIFLTRGNFCFDNASMKNKSSVDNYTHLMTGRIFHRLAAGSVHLKPCFSSTTHILLELGTCSHHNMTLGLVPWCRVTGRVDSQPSDYSWKPFLYQGI